jgi:small subunit ribosomal protein S20
VAFRPGGNPPFRRGHPNAGTTTVIDIEEQSPMANIKSQIKRIKTNEKARLRNKSVKSSVKTAIRKFREAADAGDKAKALELLQDASRKLDKAAGKGVIHANQAANKKSAMATRANQL